MLAGTPLAISAFASCCETHIRGSCHVSHTHSSSLPIPVTAFHARSCPRSAKRNTLLVRVLNAGEAHCRSGQLPCLFCICTLPPTNKIVNRHTAPSAFTLGARHRASKPPAWSERIRCASVHRSASAGTCASPQRLDRIRCILPGPPNSLLQHAKVCPQHSCIHKYTQNRAHI